MEATPEQLDALFPHPGNADIPNNLSKRVPAPVRQAGWTDESTQQVRELLKDNHRKWHIFFNDLHFHNHASHHLLAIYAMGANGDLLKAAYETHVAYQKPAFPPPEEKKISTIIDETNWKDYLGDDRYYQAYVAFFTKKLVRSPRDMKTVLEEYVFSKDANVVAGKTGDAPMMLSRFLGGFLHPLIHCGYAVEFGLPGLVAEGIAQAAVQSAEASAAYPASLFEGPKSATLTSQLASLVISAKPVKAGARPHALTVLGQIASDPAFEAKALGLPVPDGEDESSIDRVVRVGGEKLLKYAAEWTASLAPENVTAELLSEMLEEVAWMNSVVYAVGGWSGRNEGEDEKGDFNGDFFLMHLVTSSLFIPSYLNTLTKQSASVLLRTYFTIALVLYVARGRPSLPIAEFYANTSVHPEPPSSVTPKPSKDTLAPYTAPNSWLPIIQTTLVHPDEHLCKTQRALWHFADMYGGTPKGRFDGTGAHSRLEGAGDLDGTLFVRAAGLTANRLGWMREGQEKRGWDAKGFFKEK